MRPSCHNVEIASWPLGSDTHSCQLEEVKDWDGRTTQRGPGAERRLNPRLTGAVAALAPPGPPGLRLLLPHAGPRRLPGLLPETSQQVCSLKTRTEKSTKTVP